jgi:hypothetical protein
MATQNIPRGNVVDFLALGALFEIIEGPNLQSTPDNLAQVNKASGQFLQEDATRRKVSGTMKVYEIDDGAVLPEAGEVWDIAAATAAPYAVRIDDVNAEGQTEDGYEAYSIGFHYFEDITDQTLTLSYMTTGV